MAPRPLLLATVAIAFAALACSGSRALDDAGPGDAEQLADGGDGGDGAVLDSGGDAEGDGAIDGDEPVLPECDEASLTLADRGDLVVGGDAVRATVGPCSMDRFFFVAAQGSRVEIELTPQGMFPLLVAVAYPDEPRFEARIEVARADLRGEPVVLSFEPPRSGELALLVRPTVPDVAEGYDLALACVDGCDRLATRFPIVLVHGWTGWASIGPYEYFFGVPEALEEKGYEVFVAELDPYNSTEIRSVQLAEQLDRFLEEGHARKVDIIAHSQGGLDSRRAISTLGYGDRVSALVTVATPHRGTPITDIALGILPGDSEGALYFLLDLLGATAAGAESDAEASFYSLSEDYVQHELNPTTPDDPRVSYVSYTGLTCLLGMTCDDVCDVEIRWAYDLIYLAEGPNDGMVPVSSGPWGDFRGTIPADHFDEVGQLAGVTSPSFDHVAFYEGLAFDLAAEGH